MVENTSQSDGPDFNQGIALGNIADGGMLLGHVGGEPVLLVRHAGELFAVSATCTHYGAPLHDGLLVANTIRCPWHHPSAARRPGKIFHHLRRAAEG
ncbi:MAG: Rieske 2Fe-2S domain-containing protein [Rhodopila sp.]